MAWQKLPKGYQSPGYVIVSIFTPEGRDAVVNVYGMYESRGEATRERTKMIRETEEHERAPRSDLMKRWSLFIRRVADIDQMNRLLAQKEN